MSDTPPRCLSDASFWAPKFIMPSAWLEHAPFAFWLTQAASPRVIAELGTHNGYSYLSFCQAVARLELPTRCYAIDTWEGDAHAGFYGNDIFTLLEKINADHYPGFSKLIRSRFDQAAAAFPPGSIDLLHIDGRHGYEDVLEDFTMWLPKLSAQAVVLLHDTRVRERDFGVWRLWEELASRFPSFEFPHGHGLGVLSVGREPPAAVRPLFARDPATDAAIRAAYARLGAAITHQAAAVSAQALVAQLRAELAARG